jgi:hypothetical protein
MMNTVAVRLEKKANDFANTMRKLRIGERKRVLGKGIS